MVEEVGKWMADAWRRGRQHDRGGKRRGGGGGGQVEGDCCRVRGREENIDSMHGYEQTGYLGWQGSATAIAVVDGRDGTRKESVM